MSAKCWLLMLMPGVTFALSAMILRLYSLASGLVMHTTSQRMFIRLFVRRAGPFELIETQSGRFAAMKLSPKHAMLVYISGFGFPTIPDSDFRR